MSREAELHLWQAQGLNSTPILPYRQVTHMYLGGVNIILIHLGIDIG